MSRIVVINHLTLDGVMQAPARPDEDVRGGFNHGGWANQFIDAVLGRVMAARMGRGEGRLLLGRRTYEDFHEVWPERKDNPYTEPLNRARKYVVSRTLKEPLPWMNSTFLKGDAAEVVGKLKKDTEGDLVVMGTGELIRTLMEHRLIDEYLLTISPLVLGSGRRMFPEHGVFAPVQLVDRKTRTTGVLIATYRPAERKAELAAS